LRQRRCRKQAKHYNSAEQSDDFHGTPPSRRISGILLPIRLRIVAVVHAGLRAGREFCVRWFVYNVGMPFHAPPGNPNAAKRSRTPPPEDTFEEAAFLKALGEKQKSVSVKLMDGQIFRGWIEYYDKHMVRLTREGAPNLFIYKHEIMYIAEDGGKRK
jgi:host factor-I protein